MSRPSVRLELEQLEDRLAPAGGIASVTTVQDTGMKGSLRWAINQVNKDADNVINFNIGAGNQTVQVNNTALPTITKPVTINGSTVVGQIIIIQANANVVNKNGLTFGPGSDGSQVLGLRIVGFTGGDGIREDNVSNVIVGKQLSSTGDPTYAPVSLYKDNYGLYITGAKSTGDSVYDSFIGTNSQSQANLGNNQAGIAIVNNASNNTIGGMGDDQMNIISGNGNFGVYISNSNNNVVNGNYIGTNEDGDAALPNGTGVAIRGASKGNKIGLQATMEDGVESSPANLISGNTNGIGVFISGSQATQNIVQGNWIGVDESGTKALPNKNGVIFSNTQGNQIGGTADESLNVISGNTNFGISVDGNMAAPSTNNTIQNNNIGIGPNRDPKKLVAVPNAGGISLDANSNNNTVRGNANAKNKTIGILDKGKNKVFDPNSISDNGSGIDDGTTAGAPVLTSAVVSGNTLVVSGTLSSTPNATFGLEFFGGTSLDPSGSAEGQQWLGTANVTTDADGNATFQVTLNAIYGTYVTATATNMASDGGTSDFSNNVTASGEAENAVVGGNVWADANADGLPDNGETGVSSVGVQLFTSTGSLVASTTTDANGNYLFSNVTPGAYYLQFTSPSGYFFTPPYQGDDTAASHADPTSGDTEQFSLLAGEVDPYYNAGLIADSMYQPTTTALDSSESTSSSGYQVTFTATVAQTDAVPLGGSVTFMDGTTTLGTVDLSNDSGGYQASFTTSDLSVGDHSITAIYNGDGFHTSSNATLTQTVQPPLSVTALSSSADTATPGQSVTFTASVTGDGTPTGSVIFYDGTTELGTVDLDNNDNAAFTTSTLAAGSHNISAVYSGDSNFGTSTGTLTQLISQQTSSSMSLSSSVNPAAEEQNVTFTANVSGGSGTATGSVTFMDGDDILGTATLDGTGTATLTTSELPDGSQSITALYTGDATYSSNSASLTQAVNSPLTAVSLTSNANPASSGAAVTLTASVLPFESTYTPTGTVAFYDGSTELGTATLDGNGNAAFSTSSLAGGSHDITAEYSGDSNFDGSSGLFTQVISQETNSFVVLTSSANPATPSQNVTFTAAVSGNSGTPTGSVTFLDGNTVLGTGTLGSNGQATLTTSGLSLGSQAITAVYSGDATYGSNATTLPQNVSYSATLASLSASSNPVPSGQPVTFTATISPQGGSGTPTGSVTFLDGTNTLGTGTLTQVGGHMEATFTTSALSSGSHAITAVYTGDATFAASSTSLSEAVGQSSGSSNSIYLSSSASPAVLGQSVTLTATVNGMSGTPTGSVTFYDGTTLLGSGTLAVVGGQAKASITTTGLALGSNDIVVVYSGDSTYAGSASSLTQTVNLGGDSTFLSSSANPSPSGQPVTFTATIMPMGMGLPTPTGVVSFYDGTTLLGTGTLSEVAGQVKATFTTSAMGLGSHTIVAIYSGDSTFADSASSLTQTIS